MRNSRLLALLAAVSLCSSPATSQAEGYASLVARIDQQRRQANVPALGLVILQAGQPVLVRALGDATTDMPFRWGSVTKTFTALAALQLAGEHGLSLDAPIRPLLGPGYYRNDWAASHPIRLVHLLALSAGLPDLTAQEFDDNTPRPLAQALARHAGQRRTLWRPGLQHSYSNAAPGLTAALIERVSGMAFEQYLAAKVFAPLGMRSASLDPVEGLPGGYRANGITPIPYWHMTFKAFGALNAPINDMARFATALLNEGRIGRFQALPVATVAALYRPAGTLGAAHGLEVGYGMGIYGRVHNGQLFWRHGGDADGYRAAFGLLPGHGRGYLLVFNTDNPALLRRMERTIEDALTADLKDGALMPAPVTDLTDYVGRYYPSSARFGVERWQQGKQAEASVTVTGDRLQWQRGGRSVKLLPAGGGRFFRPGDPAISAVFVRDTDGRLYLQGELGNFVAVRSAPASPPPPPQRQ